MVRQLYIILLALHPARFRYRFAFEMLAIYDEASAHGSRLALLADGVGSLVRQRVHPYRPEAAAAVPAGAGIPVFHSLDTSLPKRRHLMTAATLTLVLFSVLTTFDRPRRMAAPDLGRRLRPGPALGVSGSVRAVPADHRSQGAACPARACRPTIQFWRPGPRRRPDAVHRRNDERAGYAPDSGPRQVRKPESSPCPILCWLSSTRIGTGSFRAPRSAAARPCCAGST